ncbi:hypothetical protein GCM10010485_49920 [Streptosporangium carneum]
MLDQQLGLQGPGDARLGASHHMPERQLLRADDLLRLARRHGHGVTLRGCTRIYIVDCLDSPSQRDPGIPSITPWFIPWVRDSSAPSRERSLANPHGVTADDSRP